jgi:hypothetical protein
MPCTTDETPDWVGKRMTPDEIPDETSSPDATDTLDTDDVVDRYERDRREGDPPDSVHDDDSRGGPQPRHGAESTAEQR